MFKSVLSEKNDDLRKLGLYLIEILLTGFNLNLNSKVTRRRQARLPTVEPQRLFMQISVIPTLEINCCHDLGYERFEII